ncbi:MAG: FAD-binding protein [Nitrososphaerota archaeon]|nr:FAD-binding protein [Nitrososphaerota archaeon]
MSTESLTSYSTQKRPEKTLTPAPEDFVPSVEQHKCDVLVIGGGSAGCFAAIGAKEAGADVIVAEKYNIYSSGDAGTGEDHFLACGLEPDKEWDNPKEFYLGYVAGNRTILNENHELVWHFAQELPAITERFEKMGMPFKDKKTGKYYRVQALGELHPYTVQFDGSMFKRIIAREVVDHKIPVLNHVMITRVLLDKNGQVTGATGFHTGDGSFHVFETKAVVLTTGEGCRLYSSTSGHPFDSWHSPYNTGDGIAMGFRAGAEIGNIEFLAVTLCAVGYSTPGTHAFFGMGCYLINSKGERFMPKYHRLADLAERSYLTWGIYSEMRAGRGPCFIDCRHLSKEDIERLEETLVVDKGPFGDYLRQKKIDLSKQPLEVGLSEFHTQVGLQVNVDLATKTKGLFAAGEGTTGTAGVSRAAVEGLRAGKNAASYAKTVNDLAIDEKEVAIEKARVYAPLRNKEGIGYNEFEQHIRDIMSDNVGFERTETSMKRALTLLDSIMHERTKLKARTFHDVMRTLESQNIYTIARAVTMAALQRKETRWSSNVMCVRGDYQTPDPAWEDKLVIVFKGTNEDQVLHEIRQVPQRKPEEVFVMT